MSDRVTDLLERAIPEDVDPVGYDRLATRGRRRRWAKRASGAVAGIAVIAAGALGIGELAQPSGLQVVAGGPEATAERPPAGDWSTIAGQLPSGTNGSSVGTTSDGRIVIYGGTRGADGAPERDGVVLDPETGDRSAIPAPPIADTKYSFWAPLAEDRLLVFGGVTSGGAFYDVATEQWTVIPAAPTADIAANIRAWDGTTLVVGDSFETDNPEGQELGNVELWRWRVGEDAWSQLPPAPVDAGRLETAFADGRLAVWTNPAVTDLPGGVSGSGYAPDAEQRTTRLAVLDVASGEWITVVPRDELPELADGGEATVAWSNGRVVVTPQPPYGEGNTFGPDVQPEPFDLPAPAALDPDRGSWELLDEIPDALQRMRMRADHGRAMPQLAPTTPPLQVGVADGARAALLPDGSWTTPVVADGIHRVGGDLIALGGRSSTGDGELAGALWTGAGWQPIADPDAGERVGASIGIGDDELYVVGGWSRRLGFDLLIDFHRDVLRFTP